MLKKMMAMVVCGVLFAAQAVFADTETLDGIEWTYNVSSGEAEILV